MDAKRKLECFYGLSAALTGFDQLDLEGTGMAPIYLGVAEKRAGEQPTAELFKIFDDHVADAPSAEQVAAIRRHIMSDPKLGPLARNVIKLWYFGTWYRLPSDWLLAYEGGEDDHTFVVSDLAYRNALVWQPMLAHAKGARQPGFGSWQFAPGGP